MKAVKRYKLGNSLAVQWLGFCAFIAEGKSSIPGQATKILQDAQLGQKKKVQTSSNINRY